MPNRLNAEDFTTVDPAFQKEWQQAYEEGWKNLSFPARALGIDPRLAVDNVNQGHRQQLWPERMVREAFDFSQAYQPGLRREDVTDKPAPSGPTEDSTWLGKALNVAPMRAEPNDKAIEQAMALAGLAGGTSFGLAKNVGKDVMLGSGPVMKAVDHDPFNANATMKNAPTFYSGLEHAVNNVPQDKMKAEQWLGPRVERKYLDPKGKENTEVKYSGVIGNSNGVKPEELDWVGLKDFLDERKGQVVSKKEINDFLQANKVELKEVNKGFTSYDKERLDYLDNKLKENGKLEEIEAQEYNELTNRESFKNSGPNGVKYENYQLPGGENYREMLLTLPNKVNIDKFKKDWFDRTGVDISEYNQTEINRLMKTADDIGIGDNYKSSHWDEPNPLAHIRMNDRTIDGKKSLHLEEIQSDWHQAGNKKGYVGDNPSYTETTVANASPAIKEALKANSWDLNKIANDKIYIYDKGKYSLHEPASKQTVKDWNADAVPDAPFKGDKWQELALKRMIREAAEKGYERLSWTPGEAQAARYDLSKQVDNLLYKKNEDGTYKVSAQIQGSGKMLGDKMTESQLADHVGKEVAERIAKGAGDKTNLGGNSTSQPPDNWTKLAGDGLKVGGEFHKELYNKKIPKHLEKIGKEFGVKVQKGYVKGDHDASSNTPFESRQKAEDILNNNGEIYAVNKHGQEEQVTSVKELKELEEENGEPFHSFIMGDKQPQQPIFYIDIPEKMKETVLRKGQPLFSAGHPGFSFTQVDTNPFDDENK